MKTYKISGVITVSCFTTVEAESPEQALYLAQRREVANLIVKAFDNDETVAWNLDTDGEPFDIRIEDGE